MRTILVAAVAIGVSVSGAVACSMQRTTQTDTVSVAGLLTHASTPVDPETTAAIAKSADEADQKK